MSRCYECRVDVDEGAFVCRDCVRKKERRRENAELVRKIVGAQGDSENRALGGAKVHLSQKERKSLERYIGLPVEDAQDARRKMKMKGMRFMEKGEELERILAAQQEYADCNGKARGLPPPHPGFTWGDLTGQKVPEIDWHERLRYNMAKQRQMAQDREEQG